MNRLVLGILVGAGVLLYLRSPIDLIPDRVGVAGLLDDLVALGIGIYWFWRRLPRLQGAPGAGATSSSSQSVGGGEGASGQFDAHEVLGITRGASADEIRQAYHDQLRRYHPDKVEDLGDELRDVAHRRTLDIRRAYDELKGKG